MISKFILKILLILVHIVTIVNSSSLVSLTLKNDLKQFDFRLPLAGGIAGGISSAVLFPIDTYKTMRQTDSTITSVRTAYLRLLAKGDVMRIYSGFWASVLGSIPSSALYFGTYEFAKQYLNNNFGNRLARPLLHMFSAASGNIISSIVFVPKDAIKQKMQAIRTGSMETSLAKGTVNTLNIAKQILQQQGLKGFYPSYRATLLRNIPSAIIRFSVYEEIKLLVSSNSCGVWTNVGYAIAGGCASSLSSLLTTPIDVVKTRLATGLLPPHTPILGALRMIAKTEGIPALFAGAQARIVLSALFGAVGFVSFEKAKELLGVKSD